MLRTSISIWSSVKCSRGTLASITVSYGCNSARSVNSSSGRAGAHGHFQVHGPQPLDQQVVLALFSKSSINSTWPLPRTCVNAVARLFCGIVSRVGSAGIKRAS